jgi:chromosomal replication initiator protein
MQIVEAVVDNFGIPMHELQGRSRRRHITQARFVAWWLLRKWTILSMEAVGLLVGRRDHTSVVYGLSTANESLRNTPALRRMVGEIERKLLEQNVNTEPVSVGSEEKEGESDGE